MLVQAMESDLALREAYFRDLDMIFYAGASLPQEVWTKLEDYALDARGRIPLMISSWGLTETAPACVMQHEPIGRSGVIGVPLPGVEVKLLPDDEMRCEIRVKGRISCRAISTIPPNLRRRSTMRAISSRRCGAVPRSARGQPRVGF